MPINNLWNIAIGAYTFTVDRRTLTYSLTETETNTVWAENLSLGSVEIVERETGAATVYAFGDLKLVSLSEKAGAQGKRILFGLDAPGRVPVDVYLTCTEREIQLTVEASRDTRTHRVGAITLLPGLCHIPADDMSYLVIPHRDGRILFAGDVPEEPYSFAVWDAGRGLTMPFIGAVRGVDQSALALLTDSAYASAQLSRENGGATLNLVYARDPERRRLDIRIAPLPGSDYVGIARAYRDKTIGDGGRVPFRRKLREHPEWEAIFAATEAPSLPVADGGDTAMALSDADNANRWETMEARRDAFHALRTDNTQAVSAIAGGDWSAAFVDFWQEPSEPSPLPAGVPVPLRAVVWRDAVPTFHKVTDQAGFLRALIRLAPPLPVAAPDVEEERCATLRAQFRSTYAAFLVAHRFLSPDLAVEEARYSSGVVVTVDHLQKRWSISFSPRTRVTEQEELPPT